MKKSVCVKQRDGSDCGAACLASVAAYHGLQIPVTRIRKYAGTDKSGSTLHGLKQAAEQLDFETRAARAKGIVIRNIPSPSIFHLVLENGFQHFVVVYKFKKDSVVFMDPALGKLVVRPSAEFEKIWSGVVLLLLPSEKFQTGNEKKSSFLRFRELVSPHGGLLFQALTGAIVYALLSLSTSVYVQKIVDFVLPEENMQLINMLSIVMIVLSGFQILIGYMKSLIALRTGQQIDSFLVLGYYKHLLKLPQRFFDSMRVGEIISRVTDAVRIRVFINDIALGLMVHALTILLSMLIMFIYNWKLALFMLLAIPIYGMIYILSNKINAKWQRTIMETGATLESQLVETVQGVATIKRFGVAERFHLKTENHFVPFMRAIFTGNRNGLIVSNLSELITRLLTIAILWAGSYLVIEHFLSPGELLSFYTLSAFFSAPVQAMIGANKSMQEALIAADRLFEIMDLETEKQEYQPPSELEFPDGDLIFDHVHFNYGSRTPVFRDLNLSIPRFQRTAIIGESGCGKSTILTLLQKLYPPGSGDILIGNTSLEFISAATLRKHIVAVPQQTDLFEGDFIFNISMGEHNPDLPKIFNLTERLGMHEFIQSLPAKYHTVIREQGMNLSGGQKQRLAIARAIYRSPSVLILDEATSSLDPESEQKVHETLKWYYGLGTTIILIAHRRSTIRHCDNIIYLKSTGQPSCGSHQTLMNTDADYISWWKAEAG